MTDANETSNSENCPQCNAPLPPGVPAQMCPKCLLGQALNASTAQEGGTVALPAPTSTGHQPQAGQIFGHYKIIRPIGGGGMGTVFEAEDITSTRRVALKILSHRLDAPDARERFFREGRLAAAINHPNSVYIFGTEEIAGIPVIAMELVAGGTLQDKVHKRGPLPPGEAVDAVLQIIDGLEAAQKAGILHRDVKPSNCFVSPEGMVKVGDFGLSISTAVRTEPALTADGAFLGTPSFCPPEQLRGEELNVRSDIYSVGATLYYLLTGRTPFEAQNVVALIATALEKPAPSPRDIRPDLSPELAKVVQRCLQKQRGDRFSTYEDLRRALTPFSSAAPVPAGLGMRFLAGVIDMTAISSTTQIALMICLGGLTGLIEQMSKPDPRVIMFMGVLLVVHTFYYSLLEWRYGATLGKAICRLRVARPNRGQPTFGQSLVRALIWVWPPMLPFWIGMVALHPGGWRELTSKPMMTALFPGTDMLAVYVLSVTPYLVMGLLFSTARRHNGFAALQDLASGTRVIARPRAEARSIPLEEPELAMSPSDPKIIGPYQVLQTLDLLPGGAWLLGFDMRLLRKVWIRQVPPGTEQYPAHLRNLGRPGRLRWLAGKRSESENWDAFEAPPGQPFVKVAQQRRSWERVRFWMWDLARELAASARDNTMPTELALDRVWITSDGSAKLLDFAAPGVQSTGPVSSMPIGRAVDFLGQLAASALHGVIEHSPTPPRVPIPLHARKFLEGLARMADIDALLLNLAPLLKRTAVVSKFRRAMLVLGCLAFPLLVAVNAVFGLQFLAEFEQRQPELLRVNQILSTRRGMRFVSSPALPADRDFSVYIAKHYGSFITNKDAWEAPMALVMITGEARRFAEASVGAITNATPEEVERAERRIKPLDVRITQSRGELSNPRFMLMIFHTTLAFYVGLPAIILAVSLKAGLVALIARIAFVRSDGLPASRLRLFWRALVAWSPVLCTAVMAAVAFSKKNLWLGLLAGLILLAFTVASLAMRDRGLQDRLAGTWMVPK